MDHGKKFMDDYYKYRNRLHFYSLTKKKKCRDTRQLFRIHLNKQNRYIISYFPVFRHIVL